jgi:DNA polymerase-3 subunit delta
VKIYPDKLTAQLQRDALPVYVVSGDDPLLMQEACDEIRAALRAKGFVERELFHIERGFDWSEVLYSSNSMSLFSDKKIIELRMSSSKPGDDGARALTELCQTPSPDNCLLVVMPRVESTTQRSKWFKTLESTGGLMQVWPVDAKNLPRWIENRFRRAGLRATTDAAVALADKVEGNLLAAVQEIERMKLCTDGAEIGVETVLEGVADSARYDVFLLIDAALAGNTARAVRIVEGLRLEGVEPLFVVNMLARELRSLISMSFAMRRGESEDAVMKRWRVWDRRKPIVSLCLKRHGGEALEGLHERLVAADRMVKGLGPGRAWDQIALTVARLSV